MQTPELETRVEQFWKIYTTNGSFVVTEEEQQNVLAQFNDDRPDPYIEFECAEGKVRILHTAFVGYAEPSA